MQPANQFENLADSECGKLACGLSVWIYLYADPTVDHAGHVSDMRMTNAIVGTGIHSLGWFPPIALQISTHLESYRTFLKPSFRTHVFWASRENGCGKQSLAVGTLMPAIITPELRLLCARVN